MSSQVVPASEPGPVPGRPSSSAWPSPTSSTAAEASTSPRHEASSSPVIDHSDSPSSSVPQPHSKCGATPAAPPIIAPLASTRGGRDRGRGEARSRGDSRASRGRGGKTAGPSQDDTSIPTKASMPTMSDRNTAALGLIELSCASSSRPAGGAPASSTTAVSQAQQPVQQPEAPVKPSDVPASLSKSPRLAARRKTKTSFLAPLDSPMPVDDSRDPCPLSLCEPAGPSQESVTSTSLASMGDPRLAVAKILGKRLRTRPDLVEQHNTRPTTFRKHHHGLSRNAPEGRSEAMERMDGYLAGVKAVMDKEAEQHRLVSASEEILANQVDLLRERVRNFEEEKTALFDMQRRQLRPGLVTMKMTPRVQERVNQLFGSGGKGAGSSTGAPGAQAQAPRSVSELPTAPPPKSQNPMGADGSVPPIGFFRRSSGRQDSNTSSNMTLVPSSEPEDDDGDASEEGSAEDTDSSWAPTESSWASTIPP